MPIRTITNLVEEGLAEAISSMQVGQISRPFRTITGYNIFHLVNRQELQGGNTGGEKIEYRQMTIPIPPTASNVEVQNLYLAALEIPKTISSCDEFAQEGKRFKANGMNRNRTVFSDQITGWLSEVLTTAEIGIPSVPYKVDNGLQLFIICGRKNINSVTISRQEVEGRMRRGKINMLAHRYMRDLRRSAYLDLRR